MKSELPKLVLEYLDYMETIRNRSKNTVKEYSYDLRNTFTYLKKYKLKLNIDNDIDISDLDIKFFKSIETNDFYRYLKYLNETYELKTKKTLKPASRARKVATIKSFYNYLANNVKLIDKNPVIGLDTPTLDKRLPKYLTLEESTSLLHSVKFNEQKFGRRDLCILTLFLNCGLRLSELVAIDLKDIKENKLNIIGKGNKERSIHLNSSCLSSIKSYLEVRSRT